MPDDLVDLGEESEESDPYAILEGYVDNLGGRPTAWHCKKCGWKRKCAPLKVLAHLACKQGYDVPACKGP